MFSGTDDGTNTKYAKLNDAGAISALVNLDPDFRITMYHVARPCRYTKIRYQVGDALIPKELFKYKTPEHFKMLMQNILNPRGEIRCSASLAAFMKRLSPYLQEQVFDGIVKEPEIEEESVGEKMTDILLDDLMFFGDEAEMIVSVVRRGKYVVILQEAVEGIQRLYFAYDEAEDRAIFEYEGRAYVYDQGLFKRLFLRSVEDERNGIIVDTEAEQEPVNESEAQQIHRSGNVILRLIHGGRGEGGKNEHS